jgi:hypothetical protein
MINKALRLCYNTDTGELLYSGFNKDRQMAIYEKNTQKVYMVTHAMAFVDEQVINDDTNISSFLIKNIGIREKIRRSIKEQLLKNLRQPEFDD